MHAEYATFLKTVSCRSPQQAAGYSLKIKRHLERYKDRLTPKKNNNDKIGRKPGKYQWYEIQDTVDFSADFEKPKIVYPEISMESRFAADVDGQYFLNNKCFFIPRFDPYLLSILNSKATFFYILRICSILGDSQSETAAAHPAASRRGIQGAAA